MNRRYIINKDTRYSISLIFVELQVNTTVRCHLTLRRMATIAEQLRWRTQRRPMMPSEGFMFSVGPHVFLSELYSVFQHSEPHWGAGNRVDQSRSGISGQHVSVPFLGSIQGAARTLPSRSQEQELSPGPAASTYRNMKKCLGFFLLHSIPLQGEALYLPSLGKE